MVKISDYIRIGSKFEILDEYYIDLVDSFLKNKIGNGSGEAKLYIPNYKNKYDDFFDNIERKFFFLKEDFEKYLSDSKEEFNNPKQNYKDKNKVLNNYKNSIEYLNNLEENIMEFNMRIVDVTHTGVYLKSDSKFYELMREVGLPNLSYLSIFKLSNYNDEISYYCRIHFKTYSNNNFKSNKIFFGAPGTGKSFKLNCDKNKLLEGFEDNFERVTFHPDYSYASFVGTYKPVPKKDNEDIITYDYVPGPFMRILSKALKYKDEPFLLIIEEINRANVAAVFGDVFQLLDRKEDLNSEYPIDTSEDMRRYLAKELKKPENEFKKIVIPSNMFIWATMNSADQGVFFMDTAFKRRWDFEYVDINNDDYKIDQKVFKSNNEMVYWNSLRKSINSYLLELNINEDKCIGPFFISSIINGNDDELDENFIEDFKNKVLMYLFEDAAKSQRNKLFNRSKDLTYSNICKDFKNDGILVFAPEVINEVKTKKNNDQNGQDSEE